NPACVDGTHGASRDGERPHLRNPRTERDALQSWSIRLSGCYPNRDGAPTRVQVQATVSPTLLMDASGRSPRRHDPTPERREIPCKYEADADRSRLPADRASRRSDRCSTDREGGRGPGL